MSSVADRWPESDLRPPVLRCGPLDGSPCALRDRLQDGVARHVDGVRVNGYEPCRLPHTTNLAIEGVEHDPLLFALAVTP